MWSAARALIVMHPRFARMIPETKGLSLEEMDIIFGAVSPEAREAFIRKEVRALGDAHEASLSSLEGVPGGPGKAGKVLGSGGRWEESWRSGW